MALGEAGKIPPIVLAMDMNNNHGYTTKQETVLTVENPLGTMQNPDEIAHKYKELPQD